MMFRMCPSFCCHVANRVHPGQKIILIEEYRANVGISCAGFVGRNINGGIISSRMIYAGQRLYLLSAAFPSTKARRDQDVTRFFSSLTFDRNSGHPRVLPEAPPRSLAAPVH